MRDHDVAGRDRSARPASAARPPQNPAMAVERSGNGRSGGDADSLCSCHGER
jgi:hypothetical protein